jgi:hypothetical protein
VADKDRRKKIRPDSPEMNADSQWWSDAKDFDVWLEPEPAADFDVEETFFIAPPPEETASMNRLEQIKESHSLLKQFTPKELKVLMTLKRNTSPKAWTLREDLVVLTLALSNREIAEILKDRNKEAVKKRLQLLKSKGLGKRPSETPVPES